MVISHTDAFDGSCKISVRQGLFFALDHLPDANPDDIQLRVDYLILFQVDVLGPLPVQIPIVSIYLQVGPETQLGIAGRITHCQMKIIRLPMLGERVVNFHSLKFNDLSYANLT